MSQLCAYVPCVSDPLPIQGTAEQGVAFPTLHGRFSSVTDFARSGSSLCVLIPVSQSPPHLPFGIDVFVLYLCVYFCFANKLLIILTHIWASLMAQLVKNPPAMWETWVQSLG